MENLFQLITLQAEGKTYLIIDWHGVRVGLVNSCIVIN